MPINYPDFALLKPDQMGVPNVPQAFKAGTSVVDEMIASKLKNLEAQKAQTLMPFVQPMAEQELKTAQQAYKWNPELWKSQIGYQGAQTNLMGEQAKAYPQESAARIAYNNAMASYQKALAEQQAWKNQQLNSAPSGNTTSNGMGVAGGEYGISYPNPTREDYRNQLMGTDTFKPKFDQAMTQISGVRKNLDKKLEGLNSAIESEDNLMTYLNDLSSLKKQGRISNILNIMKDASEMQKIAAGSLASQIGKSHFSNLDVNLSKRTVPDWWWTEGADKTYKEGRERITNRLREEQSFYNHVKQHPDLGFDDKNAEKAWALYQQQNPIMKSENKLNDQTPLDWKKYLTKEALEQINKTGTYNPREMSYKRIAKKYGIPSNIKTSEIGNWFQKNKPNEINNFSQEMASEGLL